jgi:DNA-binding IclR family transcriptional regulator
VSSRERKIDRSKLAPIYKRREERGLIIRELKNHPSTIPEISKVTGMEPSEVFRHVVALMQFGKVTVVGQRGDQLVYALSKR